MVGLVIVSHSEVLANGVVRLAKEMAAPELKIEPAGGIGEPDVLGTDASRVMVAIEQAMSPDGVLVLMDLGSALMSAELATELIVDPPGPIRLSSAPLAEGAVAAAVAASSGAPLDEVAAEARGALAMKLAQVTDDLSPEAPAPEAPDSGAPASEATAQGAAAVADNAGAESVAAADATVELPVLNEIGLHARPAARFAAAVRDLDAVVTVFKQGSGAAPVGASSLTNLVALGARMGDVIVVSASGPDAQLAVERLSELAGSGFGDGVPAGAGPGTVDPARPDADPATTPVAAAGASGDASDAAPEAGTVLAGVAVSAGVVVGNIHRLGGGPLEAPGVRPAGAAADELGLLDGAITSARLAIEHDREVVRARASAADAEIFDAHLALLEDDALQAPARAAIEAGTPADKAWFDAVQQVAEVYRGLDDPLLRERATDVIDVGRRVLVALSASAGAVDEGAVEEGAVDQGDGASGVVVADELTPADTAGLDPERVEAIATARGSTTAHAAILARSLGIPAVLGLGPAILAVADGTQVLLDGSAGTVTISPTSSEADEARSRRAAERARAAKAQARAHEPGSLRDGTRVEVFANAGAVADAGRAVEFGAEGIGLLRTEFLFMGRTELPDEEEQTQMLLEIGAVLDGRPLVVRTLDVGADKPLAAVPMPAEENPFLGIRGLRLELARPELLATQYRAILRAAERYPIKVMMPMVATIGEIKAARRVFEQARAEIAVNTPVEFGVMVEIPAAALAAAQLAPHVDFFSLGTNDLTQYTMAAERGNAALAPLLESPQPTVLKLIQATVEGGSEHGCWTGVCGEMAGDPATAVLLAGLGVTELSMSAPLVPAVKQALREVDLTDARAAAVAAIGCATPETARQQALRLIS